MRKRFVLYLAIAAAINVFLYFSAPYIKSFTEKTESAKPVLPSSKDESIFDKCDKEVGRKIREQFPVDVAPREIISKYIDECLEKYQQP
ncbi:hypothetical protein [Nostoc sp. FACHB-190]|uniref:hypothetical protein n=1 Tax=Nostoc sp. FACHB-190 TaxID=2692838 RepID=UPI0016831521|nr:hypothetical protein [Nostoc sp. FACHB-190]MBD2298937.1 hypothetical protein [Nostoc sp. FACHB-190]